MACPNCGAEMIPMMFSQVCKAECDIKTCAIKGQIPDTIEGWQAALDRIGGHFLKVTEAGLYITCEFLNGRYCGWSVFLSKERIEDGTAIYELMSSYPTMLD